MLQLHPHHLIYIVRNTGQERPVIPHEYGHARHSIIRAMPEEFTVICTHPKEKVESRRAGMISLRKQNKCKTKRYVGTYKG